MICWPLWLYLPAMLFWLWVSWRLVRENMALRAREDG